MQTTETQLLWDSVGVDRAFEGDALLLIGTLTDWFRNDINVDITVLTASYITLLTGQANLAALWLLTTFSFMLLVDVHYFGKDWR